MDVQYALTVLSGGEVAALSELDQLLMGDGTDPSLAYEFKPTRLTAAAGGGKSFQDENGNTVPAPLEGYVIDALRTRAYWPEKDGNRIPFCSSLGSMFGTVNSAYTESDLRGAATAMTPHPALLDLEAGRPLRERYDCATCPMAQFGSSHQDGGASGGQACKAKVQFLFLPVGWHQPCLLSVPTMSMKPWFQYASSLKQTTGREFYAFKTRIEIEKQVNKRGNPYGLFKFVNAGPIVDFELARAVMTLRKELRQYLHTREVAFSDDDVVEANGRVIDAETGEVLEPSF